MKLTRLFALLLLIQTQPQTQQAPATTQKSNSAPLSQLAHSLDPPNPFMASGGAAAEHDDSYSSDVSPVAGPGRGPVNIHVASSGSLCPTLVLDRRGSVFAYCVETATRRASLRFLDPESLAILASLDMPTSGRLGGFYMYLDHGDRLVLGAGDNHVLRISHSQDAEGHWQLHIDDNWDISHEVLGPCGPSNCDYLESVTPDWSGLIWFSTENGVVGTIDPETRAVHSVRLPAGERVANSISSSPEGVAVPSDHALYLFSSGLNGTPTVLWREVYDRGTRTKLGRLSQGTGSTPVFFGREGHPYLAITDNGDSQERLLVYLVNARAPKRLVCKIPLFSPGASADENAPIGIGDSVVLSNTFGYDYNNFTGRELQPLPGGLTRIDVRPDRSGCDVVWTNPVSSAAVPKLSIADGDIYTVKRALVGSTPQYLFCAIDFRTGETVVETLIGGAYALDTFQLAGVIDPNGVLDQPTISGIIQVHPGTGK